MDLPGCPVMALKGFEPYSLACEPVLSTDRSSTPAKAIASSLPGPGSVLRHITD
jgi:hypothetical protein